MNTVVFIQLLLAHVLVDFVIQTNKWVEKKTEKGLTTGYFWLHIILSGIFTYILLMQWTNWIVPLFILITHGLIDFWKIVSEKKMIDPLDGKTKKKLNKEVSSKYFFIDQLLHLLTIIIAWVYLSKGFDQFLTAILNFLTDIKSITILTAFILIVWPAGTTIGKITEPFRKELSSKDSLKNAGTYIGILERILVLTLVLLSQYAAIGFLIAGKSILRVSRDDDKEARKKTEYVLIGTLLSFTVAIVIGLLTNHIIKTPNP